MDERYKPPNNLMVVFLQQFGDSASYSAD